MRKTQLSVLTQMEDLQRRMSELELEASRLKRDIAAHQKDESSKKEIKKTAANERKRENAKIRNDFYHNKGNFDRPNPMRKNCREVKFNLQRSQPNGEGGRQWQNRNYVFHGRGNQRGRGGMNPNSNFRQNSGRSFEQNKPNRLWNRNNRNYQNPNLIPITKSRWQPPTNQNNHVNGVGFPYFCLVAILGMMFFPMMNGQDLIGQTKIEENHEVIFLKLNVCDLLENKRMKSQEVLFVIPIRLSKSFQKHRYRSLIARLFSRNGILWKMIDNSTMTKLSGKIWALVKVNKG
jgi:hypothetical protein